MYIMHVILYLPGLIYKDIFSVELKMSKGVLRGSKLFRENFLPIWLGVFESCFVRGNSFYLVFSVKML